MKSNRSRPTSGGPALPSALVLVALALAWGCNYGFQGGGGFPDHIRTIYIEPFENETVQFGLEQQVATALDEELPGRLGVRTAGREVADAIVRGRVVRYDDVAQNYRGDAGGGTAGGTQVVAHQVRIGVAIEIVDVRENLILYESRGVSGQASYEPASQTDRVAQQEAIRDVVQKIIDGAQSQW